MPAHDDLDPLRGSSPVHVTDGIPCRFRDRDHFHHAQVYPDTWMVQVRWQHPVPTPTRLASLELERPSVVLETDRCWYSLHPLPDAAFAPDWERLEDGAWGPFGAITQQGPLAGTIAPM